MASDFDPYHLWLGIPPEEQPPHHYRLLGLKPFESSADVIDGAANRQMAHIRTFQAGRRGEISQRILNEISAARVCLLNAERKAAYDAQLRQALAPAEVLLVAQPLAAASMLALDPAPIPSVNLGPQRNLSRGRNRSVASGSLVWIGGGAAAVLLLVIVSVLVWLNQPGQPAQATKQVAPAPTPTLTVPAPVVPKLPDKTPQQPPTPVPENPIPSQPEQPAPPIAKPTPLPAEPAMTPATAPESPPATVEVRPTAPTPTPPKAKAPPDRSFVVDLAAATVQVQTKTPQAERKLPLPDEDQRTKTSELVKSLFDAEYRAAKTAAQKIALANKLMAQGAATTDDPASRFALLSEAGDLAAKGGEVDLALKTVDDLAAQFEFDSLPAKGRLLSAAAKLDSVAVARNVAESALGLAEDALRLEQAELVLAFSKLAAEGARKARDTKLATELKKRDVEFKRTLEQLPKIAEARATLVDEPDDAAANQTVGLWLCLELDDWEQGLPLLANAAEPLWKGLAEKELTQPAATLGQLELADAWWDAGAKQEAALRGKLQAHAATWYRKALSKLTGLEKARVEKRLGDSPTGKRVATSTPAKPARPPKVRFLPVCVRLEAKRQPIELTAEAIPFTAPNGDGRRGANGFLLSAPDWQERGTAWLCDFRRSGDAWGIQFIHPFKTGHVQVNVLESRMHVASTERWGGYIPNDQGIPFEKSSDFAETFQLGSTPRKLLSYLGPDGNYRLYLDGKLVATATIPDAFPLELTSEFQGTNLPPRLPPGMAGLIIGPRDSNENVASEIAFGAVAGRN